MANVVALVQHTDSYVTEIILKKRRRKKLDEIILAMQK